MFMKLQKVLRPMFWCRFWESRKLSYSLPNRLFEVSKEVQVSLQAERPIVALESTIITHGMPYPQNLETALKVEDIVRQNNAAPATIGVIDGKIHIGMCRNKLEVLASRQKECVKISRRDLPFAISKKLTGGTTVAATMILAKKTGIEIFVTGGVGGVHRNGENSMDVSADLIELSKTSMTVVSAGIKSILDIGRTLEFLETHGVCVATYGNTKEFPAFFTPISGFSSPYNVSTVQEAAHMIMCRDDLSLQSGILIAVPIPTECAADGKRTEEAIVKALKEARDQKIIGKEVTPFILNRVKELSDGSSLKANIALIEHNADVGSKIAVQLSSMKTEAKGSGSSFNNTPRTGGSVLKMSNLSIRRTGFPEPTSHCQPNMQPRPVVIGGTVLDLTITSLCQTIQMDGGTHEGEVATSAGGVARNLADCLSRLGANPFFISAVGSDENARILFSYMNHVDTQGVKTVKDARSAVCGVLLNYSGDCLSVIGNMSIHNSISVEQIESHKDVLLKAPLVVIDGNIPPKTMQHIFHLCASNEIPVWFEPTDIHKASKPFDCDHWKDAIVYVSPNLQELRVMHGAIYGRTSLPKDSSSGHVSVKELVEECLELGAPLVNQIPIIIVTLGKHGSILLSRYPEIPLLQTVKTSKHSTCFKKDEVYAVHYPAPESSKIVSVSGAGDCFASGMIAALIRDFNQKDCVRVGQAAAILSLSSHHAVPSTIMEETVFSAGSFVLPEPRIIKFKAL